MATIANLNMRSYEAGADLSTHQYKFVKLDINGAVVLCTVAGERPHGVLMNNPLLGEAAAVQTIGDGGQVKIIASAAIAIGALVCTTNVGSGVTSITAGHVVGGYADEAAVSVGDVISITLESGGLV